MYPFPGLEKEKLIWMVKQKVITLKAGQIEEKCT